jgi:hypothetical protein
MNYSLVEAKCEACSIIGHSSESIMQCLGRDGLAVSLDGVFMQHILKDRAHPFVKLYSPKSAEPLPKDSLQPRNYFILPVCIFSEGEP